MPRTPEEDTAWIFHHVELEAERGPLPPGGASGPSRHTGIENLREIIQTLTRERDAARAEAADLRLMVEASDRAARSELDRVRDEREALRALSAFTNLARRAAEDRLSRLEVRSGALEARVADWSEVTLELKAERDELGREVAAARAGFQRVVPAAHVVLDALPRCVMCRRPGTHVWAGDPQLGRRCSDHAGEMMDPLEFADAVWILEAERNHGTST